MFRNSHSCAFPPFRAAAVGLWIFTCFCWVGIYGTCAAGRIQATQYSVYSCNASSYAPIPGRPGWFLGRQIIPTDPANECHGQFWKLVLARLDITSHRFVAVHDVLDVPSQIENAMHLNSAYDPAVVDIDGHNWVAFECAGAGIPGASTCIGPLEGDRIDPGRVYVIIDGNDLRDGPITYSASAPKFMKADGRVYLYWSAIRIERTPQNWVSISTRGTEVTFDPNRIFPVLPKNSNGPIQAFDPKYNVEVWPDADMFSIQPWKGKYIATAGATGPHCLKPSDPVPGCFHTIIGVSPAPLAVDGFREIPELQSQLPSNQGEYVRLIIRSDGGASIIGHYGKPSVPNERDIPPGIDEIPVVLP